MDVKSSGVLTWMASIRTAMVNDSGRQFFDDQVQTQGFLFLDEYLHNIKTGSKQDAIVELVKTPGRKRDAPKKTRAAAAAAARAQTAITLSLEDDDLGKENSAPVNKFHQALLQAKATANEDRQQSSRQPSVPPPPSSSKTQSKQKSVKIAEMEEVPDREEHFIDISSSPQPHALELSDVEEEDAVLPTASETHLAPHTDTNNELSVIAEDDEPAERSRASAQPPHVSPRSVQPLPSIDLPSPPEPDDEIADFEEEDVTSAFHDIDMDVDDYTHATAITVSDATNTFHSIPLSPLQPSEPSPKPATLAEEGNTYSNLAFHPTTDISVPIRDHDSKPTVTHKPSLSQFTGLPQPSPLHKSTRAVAEPTFAPGPPPPPPALTAAASKRSSWFSKAREANSKRVSTTTGAASSNALNAAHASGMKRKSGEMLADLASGQRNSSTDGDERKYKMPKTSNDVTEALTDVDMEIDVTAARTVQFLQAPAPGIRSAKSVDDIPTHTQKGVFVDFKKTVEGMGARAGKSIGKSLGDDAAAELAKAKAVAEARVAERQKRDGSETDAPAIRQSLSAPQVPSAREPSGRSSKPTESESDRRLSVSDLVFNSKDVAKDTKEKLTVPSITIHKSHISDISTSTTPPESPRMVKPAPFVPPSAPVFNKPPTVFVPPPTTESSSSQPTSAGLNEFAFKLPSSNAFPLRAPFGLGLQPSGSKLSCSPRAKPLSGTSSKSSLYSDPVFDSQPAWAPASQNTQCTSQDTAEFKYAEQLDSRMNDLDDDDDDSWHMDDKLATTDQQWTPFGAVLGKEDSMTWSTLPSESQRGGHSGPLSTRLEEDAGPSNVADAPIPEQRQPTPVLDDLMDEDVNELVDAGVPTVGLVGGKASVQAVRSESQMSMVSSSDESSQPGGFFGHASKLVSSMLGVNKKDKGPVKSIQLAAAAAKKHQEEQDRKTTRLKEMEARRQAAVQRKTEEEKVKAEEAEKKTRDEAERRKKEREEHTGKRPLKVAEKRVNDEDTKKKKVFVEIEKPKPASKDKPALKEKKEPAPSRIMKPTPSQAKPKTLTKQASSSSMQNGAGASTSKLGTAEKKTVKIAPSSQKGKGKAHPPKDESDAEDKAPSKVVKSQMAARLKAQAQSTKPDAPPAITSESIELPEPNSEYSDSDDENRRGFDAPDWAQSPEVLQQLGRQKDLDPDDIFGPIRPLHMEDMFRTRQSRFRARTSSANWSGPDGLTELESREYAKRMGFR
ncbi:hypothetical protein OF83DRAFT_1179382 [Amylostereum chailletii]|nr:hypothetical protein OF83DRAFT_1179382 [Amylostereum chailletii]